MVTAWNVSLLRTASSTSPRRGVPSRRSVADLTTAPVWSTVIADTSAIEKNDFDNLYTTFPQLKPFASSPLLRETAIQPNDHAEGMVLLHFPVTQAQWDQRTSATVTITTYSQGDLTVTIPKS